MLNNAYKYGIILFHVEMIKQRGVIICQEKTEVNIMRILSSKTSY